MDILGLVGQLISSVFSFILALLVTVVQIITLPINLLINASFPDLSAQITQLSTTLNNLLEFLPFLLSFLPPGTVALVLLSLAVEVAFLAILRSTYVMSKVWLIVQRIKFW